MCVMEYDKEMLFSCREIHCESFVSKKHFFVDKTPFGRLAEYMYVT